MSASTISFLLGLVIGANVGFMALAVIVAGDRL